MKKQLFFLLYFIAGFGTARAQFSATLSGYPLVTTGWNVGGNASVVDSAIQLTPPAAGQSGYVYYNTPINLTGCGQFTVKFDFRIRQALFTSVADGIAFWYISNPPSGFASGGGVGLPANPNGLIMIMDTYDNTAPVNVPLETLLGYDGTIPGYIEGSSAGLLTPVNPFQNFIDDGNWHHCQIDYSLGNVNVYFNYSSTPSQTGYYPMSIPGYFGFSSSTGSAYSTQSVKRISITALGSLPAPAVTSPVYYCVGATAVPVSATPTPGGTLHWYTTDTATVVSLPGAPTPSTATAGTYTWYVRQTSGTCISPPDSVKVVVNAPPAPPTVTDPSPYCQGDAFVPFTVTPAAGATVYWYPTAAGTGGSTTAPVVSTATPGTYTYYFNQAIASCNSVVDSIKIVVNPVPAAIAGPVDVCQYLSIALSDGTTGGTWSSSNTGVATVGSSGVVNGVSAGTAVIKYQLPTACKVTKTVTVHPKPAKPVVTPPSYCQFSLASPLSATPTTGLLWYGPGVTSAMVSAPTPITLVAGTTNYYVTETSSFGCVSDSAVDAVTIKPQPAGPLVRDSSICQYSTTPPLNFLVDSAVGSHLSWFNTLAGGGPIAVPVPPSTLVTYPTGTTWYVSQTVNGCESGRVPVKVKIVYLPRFNIIASSQTVCIEDTLSFLYSNTTPLTHGSFYWTLPLGATTVDGTNITDSAISVLFNMTTGQHTIYLTTGELYNKCTSTDTLDITVQPLPTAHAHMTPDICQGDTVTLSLSERSDDAYEFSWLIDGTPLAVSSALDIVSSNSNSGGPFSVSWNDTGNHIITVSSVTSVGCKSEPTRDSVFVHALPDALFTVQPKATGALCLEDSILFSARTRNANYSYLWQPEHCFNNNNKPEIWGKAEQGRTDIVLTVTNPFGCKASSDVQLSPDACCTVLFPSAFSPNGDNKNDRFRPIFTGYHNFHHFRVVNRWGQVVFESANSTPEWDGNFNGVPQDMGVYYFYIKYDCGGNTVEQKGDITLVR